MTTNAKPCACCAWLLVLSLVHARQTDNEDLVIGLLMDTQYNELSLLQKEVEVLPVVPPHFPPGRHPSTPSPTPPAERSTIPKIFVRVNAVIEEKQCDLLGGWFGWAIQFFMIVFCCATLYVKWAMVEGGSRAQDVFLFDASKQLVANGLCYILNIVFAMFMTQESNSQSANQCAAFWITVMLDSTTGCFFNWVILKASEMMLGYKSGCYETKGSAEGALSEDQWESRFQEWRHQTMAFTVVVLLSQLFMYACMVASMPFWLQVGVWGTDWIEDVRLKLLYVGLVTPITMYTMYFWVSDWYLQASEEDSCS